jgi:4,5-DOPA dioxygenase extradiol
MFPTIFLSHGSPMLALTDCPARDFLRGLGKQLGRPSAIMVASAHWQMRVPVFGSHTPNTAIHDFSGFPPALYDLRYEPPGAPAIAMKAADLLSEAGWQTALDNSRGLDHGAWVPLMLMYPEADIPVLQVSIEPLSDPAYHLRLGRLLEPLRDEDVLIVGSGSFTHNLARMQTDAMDAPPAPGVTAFADWFDAAISQQREDDLLNYRSLAPYAAEQHPTEEHLLPFYVALGAAGAKPTAERLHSSAMYSSLRMDAYGFR